jgi:hypothetical protein
MKDEVFSLNGSEPKFLAFCRDFTLMKSSNGNLLALIEQTVKRLLKIKDFIVTRKQLPPPTLIEQCCVALHFCALCFNFIASTQLVESIACILGLNAAWPEVCASDVDFLMKSFIDETSNALTYSQSSLSST